MFVSVIHRISDPERFSEMANSATIPQDLRLPQVISAADRSTTVCLWEAPSVARVRDFLEPLTAGICVNEYAEVDPSLSMGLPAATVA
ncbi:MAG: hypothetical protein JO190_05520 [Candidatus Eremiobacteraeota bacterium]|nr:hypothetical protein [Candidatus Eremiobacteraeota bacterium]MBV8498098.1 hypothetical protein [Candidatus Eremiobacteraeota bacterium]